jgi:hypothetical protein
LSNILGDPPANPDVLPTHQIDRRRPGRIRNVSANLIAILRGTPNAPAYLPPTLLPILRERRASDLDAAKCILTAGLFSLVFWVVTVFAVWAWW